MNVVIFGATGMIGRGVLLEALDSTAVETVLSIGRRRSDVEHPKLRQLVHDDFENFEALAAELTGIDACFWCLGIPSAGLDEAAYSRITHDFTLAAATVLHRQSPEARFCFLSGAGADATESGRLTWARVKGRTENAVARMGFREAVVFRPAFVRALRGTAPRGLLYRAAYLIFGVFAPVARAFGGATSTVEIGRAMIAAAQGLSDERVLDSRAINELAAKLAPEAT